MGCAYVRESVCEWGVCVYVRICVSGVCVR